jgi:hypothetical protein
VSQCDIAPVQHNASKSTVTVTDVVIRLSMCAFIKQVSSLPRFATLNVSLNSDNVNRTTVLPAFYSQAEDE